MLVEKDTKDILIFFFNVQRDNFTHDIEEEQVRLLKANTHYLSGYEVYLVT